jgi:dihydrofolate reductase
MSLNGFIAGPDHEMDWVFDSGGDYPAELVNDLIETSGAIVAGRGSYDVGRRSTRRETSKPFGGAWSGPQFVLTHDPPADEEDQSITFVSGDIETVVGTALDAAGDENVLIFGANVAGQCLDAGLVDEILLFVALVLLGDGIRIFDAPGRDRVDLEQIRDGGSGAAGVLHYRVRR